MSAALHRNTPTVVAFDPRGLTVRTVAYHRASAQAEAQARVTRQVYGTSGLLRQQGDPRLPVSERLVHSLSGATLLRDSVDAGTRLMLMNEAGQLLQAWDSRGACQRYEYDTSQRPIAVFEQVADEPRERCVERLDYAGPSPEAAALNRCGQLIRHADPAGTLLFDEYAIDQRDLKHTRRFRPDTTPVDWPATVQDQDALLEKAAYTTARRYDAFGALLEQTDAKGNCQHRVYGLHGRLKEVAITLKGGARTVLLNQRRYNASGQVEYEWLGARLIKTARYAPQNARLLEIRTYRQGEAAKPLQDLTYSYDPVGNIVSLSDVAQPTQWQSNARIEALSRYEYDSLYQLTLATGREHGASTSGQAPPAQLMFGATDAGLWRNYTQRYTYDESGNLTQLRHTPGTGTGYSRQMTPAAQSNRAVPGTSLPSAEDFDGNGNQRALGSGQQMGWNVRNQLAHVTQVAGAADIEAYIYDAHGTRALKVRRNGMHSQRTYYLPGLQMHWRRGQRFNLLDIDLEGCRVTVLQWAHGKPDGLDAEQIQFNLLDHLRSSALVVDDQAQLLSQEGYYPYGATAWSASRSALQGDYRCYRYAGKERDATGLYYYGARYYAPWLMRWISPDPGGDVDGLNLYAMVHGNPMGFIDAGGGQTTFGEQFQPGRGDMIFGLGETLGIYASLWSRLGLRGEIVADFFINKDMARWAHGLALTVRAFERFRQEAPAMFRDLSTPDPQGTAEVFTRLKSDLRTQISTVEEQVHAAMLSRYSGCLATSANQQFTRRFVGELSESRYSLSATAQQFIGHGLVTIQEKGFSRTSKSALATLTGPQSTAVVHFALDGVDMMAVVGKTRKSVTGSELRWLYRHRTQLAGRVVFYQGQRRVDAPWDTHAAAWKTYRPRSTRVTARH